MNAIWMVHHAIGTAMGDKRHRYKPIRSYPGSPFDPDESRSTTFSPAALLGGFRRMSRAETVAWLRERGLPTPTTTT